MDLESKLNVFQDFLDCAEVRLRHFNGEMRLLSGQDDGSIFETLFRIGGGKQLIYEYSMKMIFLVFVQMLPPYYVLPYRSI